MELKDVGALVTTGLLITTSAGLLWTVNTKAKLQTATVSLTSEVTRLRGLLETTHGECDAAKSETAMCRQAVDYCGQSRRHLEEALKAERAK